MATENHLKSIIETSCDSTQEEDGLTRFQLKATVKKRDEKNMLQLMTVGDTQEGELKTVLLLGETGAGKTHLINSLVNHIFGVQFGDTFRLQLKDQLVGEPREQTQSQTDYITAYLFYQQPGMHFNSNYMFIDTPGFGDTRGPEKQILLMERLRMFLLGDFGIDYLNCVGIVMKANNNRELENLEEVLTNIATLLGSDIGSITQLLATFAADDTTVHLVARNAGIQFTHVNDFDNWPLYISQHKGGTFSQRQKEHLKFRWENMNFGCATFLEILDHVKPISLEITRELASERKKLDVTLMALRRAVETASNTIKSLKMKKNNQKQYEDLASKVEWKRNVSRVLREKYKVMEGYHAHNCDACDKTCIFPCEDPSNIAHSLAGAAAGAAAVGAVAGAAAGPPGVAIGALIGGASGGTGTYVLTKKECRYAKKDSVCYEDGCMHQLSDHSISTERIIRSQVQDEVIDHEAKSHFSEIISKVNDLKNLIELDKSLLEEVSTNLHSHIEFLIESTKKIEELSLKHQPSDPVALIKKLGLETKEIGCAEIYNTLSNAASIILNGQSSDVGNMLDTGSYNIVLFKD